MILQSALDLYQFAYTLGNVLPIFLYQLYYQSLLFLCFNHDYLINHYCFCIFYSFSGSLCKISTLKQIFMTATIQWPIKILKLIAVQNLINLFSMFYFISSLTKGAAVQVRGVDRLGWRAGLGLACRHTAPQHRNHQPENYIWLEVHLHIFYQSCFC